MATSLLAVDEALRRLLVDAEPVGSETVALADGADRVLAEPLQALRTQPPFPASAMDGYAARSGDLAIGNRLAVIGEAPASWAKARPCASSPAHRCPMAPTRS